MEDNDQSHKRPTTNDGGSALDDTSYSSARDTITPVCLNVGILVTSRYTHIISFIRMVAKTIPIYIKLRNLKKMAAV